MANEMTTSCSCARRNVAKGGGGGGLIRVRCPSAIRFTPYTERDTTVCRFEMVHRPMIASVYGLIGRTSYVSLVCVHCSAKNGAVLLSP